MFKFIKISWQSLMWRLLTLATMGILFSVGTYMYVSIYAEDYVYDSVLELPEDSVALVLGTTPRTSDGRRNIFFLNRINAAVELYESGKAQYFILSGDNSTEEYNEPEVMKQSLTEKGIPEDVITLDYAGFRTLDSMVRAKEVFGQEELIVVSQKFHNERAVFIGRSKGIDVVAFNAVSPEFEMAPRPFLREVLARVNMLWDLFINDTDPKFLGEPVEVGSEI